MVRVTFGRFIPGGTFMHRLDPGVKLLCSGVLFSVALLGQDWSDLTGLAVVAIAALVASGAQIRDSAGDIWSLRLFLFVTVILHLVLNRGDPWLELPLGLAVTRTGLERGLFFSLKIILIATLAGSLLRTTHPSDLVDGFTRLAPRRARWGGGLRRFALVLGLATRFLPILVGEAERIRLAQVSRGLKVEGGLLRRLRSLQPLVTPLVWSSLNRADRVAAAMATRGYHPDTPRTRYRSLRFGAAETAALTATGAALLQALL